jgi:hypothetical protein
MAVRKTYETTSLTRRALHRPSRTEDERMNGTKPYRNGRGRAELKRVVVLMRPDELGAVDEFGVPNAANRTEAIRLLLRAGLNAVAKAQGRQPNRDGA